MNLFAKIKPTLLIDGKNIENYIEQLKNLSSLNAEGEKLRDNELRMLSIGLYGERQILYELLNSNIPMYIFHDVYYELDTLSAQIDFIVVTEYKVFVIECKNIIGNVIVNNYGNFIREYNNKKEGMYSPITQNQRHIDLLANLVESRQTLLNKLLNNNIKNYFDSVIVFTNPKTIIKSNFAPKNIKCRIIRADNIVSYIKKVINNSSRKVIDIESYARFFEFHNTSINKDYISKYNKYIVSNAENALEIADDTIREKLKSYRMSVAKDKGYKLYFIFTNEQLEEILKCHPNNKEQLLKIKGFGNFKVEQFGQDIIDIINE